LRDLSVHRALAALAVCACLIAAPATAGAADPARYRAYYDIFNRGNAKIPGHDTRWVPQGLTYWPEQDALVISYYDGEKAKNSRLAVIDRGSGAKRKILELPERGHVGGLAMSPNYLWVASSGTVSRIAKSELAGTGDGGRVGVDASWKLPATSFATMEGDNLLWLGTYQRHGTPTAYRYPLKGESIHVPSGPDRKIKIPLYVQGMAVFGDQIVFSRSRSRNRDSRLEIHPASSPLDNGRSLLAPNMSEGIVFGHGELHVLYESGAKEYSDADYRVKTVHHARTSDFLG
jgi:hypothetical protein